MHPNPKFAWRDQESMRGFARDIGFGVVFASGPAGPIAAHVPFVLLVGDRVAFHVARGNALTELPDGADVLLVVNGPNAYVSPDWLGLDHNQVPTWNYLAVEMRGWLARRDRDGLLAQIDALSHEQERRLAPKPPWTRAKMDPSVQDRMAGAIVGFSLDVAEWRATAKVNQNKPEAARGHVADVFDAMGRADMAALIRQPPE